MDISVSNLQKKGCVIDCLVYIGDNAITKLIEFAEAYRKPQLTIICDQIEYQILGQIVEQSLIQAGFNVQTIVLAGEEVVPDEDYIVQIMLNLKNVDQIFLSVGSGTMTDLVRFISYHNRSPFISLPTAPSVDAYASSGSALTIGGYKLHIKLHSPIAIFANLGVLCVSPRQMIASSFGDMFGKFTAVADWKLAHLVNNEPYDEFIAQRSFEAAQGCAS
jgi:glycerol-1-phosphate dehydrogenase [NAD(P)+]